ncbi:hypothetical protein ACFO1B_31980 [Dactylosporangium siamense]|uniref:Uncharacterized protein n=1 Tax=Dactylosporangium siamense TaxID=685454 RepID=A0A919PR82_9ACTN|nr:hypothetical protein [Dactylosporangium siamense]GIG48619.1 hypothetical protein Dsi01nite_066600 [Dactylosporangium siamense]
MEIDDARLGSLHNARGTARHLAALTGDDPAARTAAVHHLWDPRNARLGDVFRQAGLPHDRAVCRVLAADVHPGQLPLW